MTSWIRLGSRNGMRIWIHVTNWKWIRVRNAETNRVSDPDPVPSQALFGSRSKTRRYSKCKQNINSKIFQINLSRLLWQISINERAQKNVLYLKNSLLLHFELSLRCRNQFCFFDLLCILHANPDPGGIPFWDNDWMYRYFFK